MTAKIYWTQQTKKLKIIEKKGKMQIDFLQDFVDISRII